MTASRSRLLTSELPSPDAPGGIEVTMLGLQHWLERRATEPLEAWQSRLAGHLVTINGQLEAQQRETMRILAASPPLSDSTSQLDRIVPRSTPMESPPVSSTGRSARPSEYPPQGAPSPQWSQRFGPRVAARLAAATSRRG